MLRLLFEHGEETILVLSKDAFASGETLQKGCIYTMDIPGTCVKQYKEDLYGVDTPIILRCIYPVKCSLATAGWPTTIKYDFKQFVDFPQVPDKVWIDTIGRVAEVGHVEEKYQAEERPTRLYVAVTTHCSRIRRLAPTS